MNCVEVEMIKFKEVFLCVEFFFVAAFLMSFIFVGQAFAQSFSETPQWVKNLPDAKNAKQLFVVAGLSKTTAWISMHEKDANGNWKQIVTTP